MSKDVYVNWFNSSGNLVKRNIPLRLDLMSARLAADLGGAAPYDSYLAYTTGGAYLAGVQRGDTLVDTRETDPKTHKNTTYRIFGNPDPQDLFDMNLTIERVFGT